MAFYTPKHYCLGIIPEGLEIRKVRSVMKLKRHDDRILKALQRGKQVNHFLKVSKSQNDFMRSLFLPK